jgi:hypothetical protein
MQVLGESARRIGELKDFRGNEKEKEEGREEGWSGKLLLYTCFPSFQQAAG